jgi:hypothetical protein
MSHQRRGQRRSADELACSDANQLTTDLSTTRSRRRTSNMSNISGFSFGSPTYHQNGNQRAHLVTPPFSIRDNARISSRSNNTYASRTYEMNYFVQQRATAAMQLDIQGVMQGSANDHDREIDLTRICYCDQPRSSTVCWDCQDASGIACEQHTIIICSSSTCHKQFHLACLKKYAFPTHQFQVDFPYVCLHCTSDNAAEQVHQPWQHCRLNERCKRIGVTFSNDASHNSLKTKVKKTLDALSHCSVPADIINQAMNQSPLPYPNVIEMEHSMPETHAELGCKFEISCLMYSVHTCSCCGIVIPVHIDPNYPKDEGPLPRIHFTTKFYKAWECRCLGPCRGQQFYAVNRSKMIEAYRSLHEGRSPSEVITGCDDGETNAMLCHDCAFEYNKNRSSDIIHGKTWILLSLQLW